MPLNVQKGEGVELAKQYKVGFTYPVFILTNSKGDVIKQWVGYAGGSAVLVKNIKWAMSDLRTLDERIADFKAKPVYSDGLYLAGYYSKTGEHLQSIDYYRKSVAVGAPGANDYTFEIFKNMAEAVWKDMIAYDNLPPAADAVLRSRRTNADRLLKVAELMTRVANKNGRVKEAAKYYDAVFNAVKEDPKALKKARVKTLRLDYVLYIEGDAARATAMKKEMMGPGWEEDRDRFYGYARWSFDRGINLVEAEMYARKTLNLVGAGMYRARVYNTIADICFAQGKKDEAIMTINMAIDEDPDNVLYHNQLKRFQGGE